jgi:hypothetical protein
VKDTCTYVSDFILQNVRLNQIQCQGACHIRKVCAGVTFSYLLCARCYGVICTAPGSESRLGLLWLVCFVR